jgi:ankyrin repeat protein
LGGLHYVASQVGLVWAVKELLKLGAISRLTTEFGSTPLHYAAAEGHAEICIILLEHADGYDLQQLDDIGRTPMHYALLRGHQKVQEVLTAYQLKQQGGMTVTGA